MDRHSGFWIVLAFCTATPLALRAQEAPATAPASQPATASAPTPIDPELDAILSRLESRGETVHDLTCQVKQIMKGLTVGEVIVKQGELKYLRGAPNTSNARFSIHFTKITQDDFPLKPEWYVFDGRWFIEAKESTRTVVRREVVREGETLDLFTVDDSPFPLPFGQKKAELLEYFDIEQRPLDTNDPKDSKHLYCVPKPGTEKEKEFKEVHFYIDPKLDLPVKIVAHRKTGTRVSEIHTVTFPGLSNEAMNRGLRGGDFEFKTPGGWSETTETLDANAPPSTP